MTQVLKKLDMKEMLLMLIVTIVIGGCIITGIKIHEKIVHPTNFSEFTDDYYKNWSWIEVTEGDTIESIAKDALNTGVTSEYADLKTMETIIVRQNENASLNYIQVGDRLLVPTIQSVE